jgi:hypothetical protein
MEHAGSQDRLVAGVNPVKREGILPVLAASLFWSIQSALGNEVDENKLPQPAAVRINFSRNIKPILESHCLKCHSNEKPKSNFRLTSRDAALKGGSHGVDIIPGQSGRSPLITYVARLDEEMAMPPEGRGTPLTPEEVGLLRAWIDQGVTWESTEPESNAAVTIAPTVGWTTVSGDSQKFRELYWQRDGWNRGLEEFELLESLGPDSKIAVTGHILQDDYKLTLSAEKNDLGFVHFGWTQFRKYYDNNGGYYPDFTPSTFALDQDLHTDIGRAWTDIGLTLPNWPRLVLGYEYQYRDGSEATLQWGPVSNGTETRDIYPAYKQLFENDNILKFDLDYELGGVVLSDSFRGDWYHLSTHEFNESGYTPGGGGMALTTGDETQKYFQGANTVHLEKQFTDWLFASGGYLYSKLNSDGTMDVQTLNPAFLGPPGVAPGWNSQQIQLQRESSVFSVAALLGPWKGLTLSLGLQNEWTRQTGLGTADVNIAIPFAPYIFPVEPPQSIYSDLDRSIFGQEIGLRFSKIPFTTLFAEARFQQDDTGQYQEELNGLTPFLQDTDAQSRLQDFRLGFNTSPWRRLSVSGSFQRYDHNTDYNNFLKEIPMTDLSYEGYPAFITHRELLSNEGDAKLAFQVTAWLKASLSYQRLANDYRTTTEPITINPANGLPANISPGTGLLAGTYDSHVASLNLTFTPWRRLFLSTTLGYQKARTVSDANNNPSVAPYAGNIYSIILSGNYALSPKTDLVGNYSFSTADFAQDNVAAGLPLGINYHQHALEAGIRRHFTKETSIGLQYRFYIYTEPSGGGVSNFEANAIFATLVWRMP